MTETLSAAEYETVTIEVGSKADRVATLTVDRPEARNAMNETVRADLTDALSLAEDDPAVRTVVLTGSETSDAFVAGADLRDLQERSALEQREQSKRPRIYERIESASVPVIARLNGYTLGGGCELALACDVRIAHEDAELGQPEIRFGILPGGGGTQRLPRLIGMGQALKLNLSGETVDAAKAADLGLVDEVYGDDDLDDRVYELAGKMAEKSPIALELTKKATRASERMDIEAGKEYEAELFAILFGTEDKQEGIDAFFEDRDPEFVGR